MNPQPPLKQKPTVVGIGASAGGLGALKIFLDHIPADSGLVFVVVVHLSPDHESFLAQLLQPHARLPIEQVTHTVPLEPNHVYIIPPNANLSAIDSHLRLSKLEELRHDRAPIDHFFRTLAGTRDAHSVAVVLTGTGTDGTLGIKDIKANGGVVIVQDPAEAEYDGMPRSAIATGVVDFVLPVAQIPAEILRFDRIQPRVPPPSESDEEPQNERILLQKVFSQLQMRTGRDFSRYKRSTVFRRIARRMQLNYIEDLGGYVEKLREQPEEVRALADDLLITVTHFFRDPEVFEKLETGEIGRLFVGKGPLDTVRVWSVGCATGEEAYSLAMLLVEEAGQHEAPPQIQIFATDLHRRSLEKARDGFYPGDITTDVSPERLKRFFQEENSGYRIRKDIRDLVIFAPHNLLSDPPFSRLDLISCRNLLIYLERDVQQDVIELFHYALNPEGALLLGPAESLEASELFRVEDKRLCLFRKRSVSAREPRLPAFPLSRSRFADDGEARGAVTVPAIAYGSLHQRLVAQYAPPSLLVGADNKILHLSAHAERYLIPFEGVPPRSVVRMAREELQFELRVALQQAREKKENFDSRPILVHFSPHPSPVVLHLRPSMEPDEDGCVLVIFEEREPMKTEGGRDETPVDSDLPEEAEEVHVLRADRDASQQRLRVLLDEYNSSREEAKTSSEEMQSANEELRSTLEELETSKEELQSINEELQTVNQQNRHKVEELSQLSSDLQNLLIATDIATLFLDRDLRVLRFTPKVGNLFNVRASDQGRPISDLTQRLGYADLRSDAEAVFSRLVPVERELQDDAGKWYLTRVHPYRSSDDRIEGVVVTFIDITDRKDAERMRLELQAREQASASEAVLRQKEVELARVARTLMVGELAASIAHEINQPLAAVVINAEAALHWLAGETPDLNETKQSLVNIVEDGNRAGAIIRQVREFVKGESNPAVTFDIGAIIRNTLALVQFDLNKKRIAVSVDIAEGLSAVSGDPIQIEQVLLNVIINAEEAMASVSEQLSKLRVSAQKSSDGGVLISVSDSGIGLDPLQIDTIYDAFFTTKSAGMGMGLSISRSIIQNHGGRIWATHNEGPGLTIHFSLPVGDAAVPELAAKQGHS